MSTTRMRLPTGPDPVDVQLKPAASGAPDHFIARVGNREIDVRVHDVENGSGRIQIDGRIVPFHVLSDGRTAQVWLRGQTYKLELVTTGRAGAAERGSAAASGDVAAPMPGTVLRVLVKPADFVIAQQPLVVMVSMKMEMTLAAPRAGQVAAVQCREGQMVEMGTVLVKLSEPSDAGTTA